MTTSISGANLDQISEWLFNAREKSLVVCGSNDVSTQVLVNYTNQILGNYGTTIDLEKPSMQSQGNDPELFSLLDEIRNGSVSALFLYNCNPVYDLPKGQELAKQLKKMPLVVNFSAYNDETTSCVKYVCPDHHFLETWNDAESVTGVLSVTQPTIQPRKETRALIESLSAWMETPTSALEVMRALWKAFFFTKQTTHTSFDTFWDTAVARGFTTLNSSENTNHRFRPDSLSFGHRKRASVSSEFTLVLYPTIGMYDGRHAQNAWLQELPDPVSKVTWDNYVILSAEAANHLHITNGDVLRIATINEAGSGTAVELPALIIKGVQHNTVAIALGYGRKGTERFAAIGPQWIESRPTQSDGGMIGKSVSDFISVHGKSRGYEAIPVTVQALGRKVDLAQTQIYSSTQMPEQTSPSGDTPRPIIQRATLDQFMKDPSAGGFHKGDIASLWGDIHPYKGHHWGMAIDLSKCTGCSACVIGCQVENNIPVVGKDEVRRNREMHWLRIDQYVTDRNGSLEYSHQPILCHHCDNAPCETVCPVLATVHSEEGLNQQVYNRCVGTRYCSNNCPYKIRRFNWFNYNHEDEEARLVLNPDVTVRMRGVMEKCSFCVQRIEEARITARNTGKQLEDSAITPACQQSCPAQAIVFGDMNDSNSALALQKVNPRHYSLLEELGIRPSLGYLTMVRNNNEEGGKHEHV